MSNNAPVGPLVGAPPRQDLGVPCVHDAPVTIYVRKNRNTSRIDIRQYGEALVYTCKLKLIG